MKCRSLTFERAEIVGVYWRDVIDLPGASSDAEIFPCHSRLKFGFEMSLEFLAGAAEQANRRVAL